MFVWDVQMRGADEGTTVFMRCGRGCGFMYVYPVDFLFGCEFEILDVAAN